MVAVCGVVTPLTTALNPVVSAPARTVTALGTVTAGLLLVKLTLSFLFAAEVRYTEQASVAVALYALLWQETLLSDADADAAIDAASKTRIVRMFRLKRE